ncbi:16S rRNA (adenine(1518)-N(6)/adenine(1519)-N(6))-dimethyltransferase RsmA [Egibacter rhizosphaerae]|uniref:16S rRNA (adenine(1518)-N(6)/adenine(1519)-N(6))- dimethyltransferase RsmA n=1 Tax=Egibacter rhizosphaerae TaxID=1670831 RepID=UPI001F10F921|nr:16S rRNA (adenine(1518)-N(6)/adenine(1519)-N(6))-dimethyltransferase RsmA [Egibacter rhizosphaerae]
MARAEVGPRDLVVEVGPGLGALTLVLREAGAHVLAVEVDRGLVTALREVVLPGLDGVDVVHADAMTIDWSEWLERPAVFVANLPYHAATPILLRALASGAFTRLHAMVQREVGERWAARAGHPRYGAVSVKVAAHAAARVDAAISRRAFYPQPNVDSVTVRLEPRPWHADVPRDRVLGLVEAGFAQRRKRLRNTLAREGSGPAHIEDALARAGLSTTARPEELDLEAWIALARALDRS